MRLGARSAPRWGSKAVLVGSACLSLPSSASANDFVPSARLQTGTTYTRGFEASSDDYFVAATPEISYFVEGKRYRVSFTYVFAGSLNTFLPNGISNRLAIATAHELSPVTRLTFGAEGTHSLLGNYILVKRTAATQLGAIPSLNVSLLTLSASQALRHELGPRLRLTQTASLSQVSSLEKSTPLDNLYANGGLELERVWDLNAIGGQLDVQYARSATPETTGSVYTIAGGPTWDHDFTDRLSMSLAASAQLASSPDLAASTQIGPAGRAALRYGTDVAAVGVEYTFGIEPNLLLGTLLRSHQATLRGYRPLSERHRVLLAVSAGYVRAETIDLLPSGLLGGAFDAVLHDAELTWEPSDYLELSARYQFMGQTSGGGASPTPAIVRHSALLGLAFHFTPRNARPKAVPTGFSSRADGAESGGPLGRGTGSASTPTGTGGGTVPGSGDRPSGGSLPGDRPLP